MSGCERPFSSKPSRSRSGLHSITYQGSRGPGARASSDISCFAHKNHVSEGRNHSGIKSESKSSEILSTTEVISAVGHIWGLLSSFSIPESNDKLNYNCIGCQRNVVLGNIGWQKVGKGTSIDTDGKYLRLDVKANGQFVPVVKPQFEFVSITQKMSVIETLGRYDIFLNGGSNVLDKSWCRKGCGTVGISYEHGNIYGWMRRNIPQREQCPCNIIERESGKNGKSCSQLSATNNAIPWSIGSTHPTTDLDLGDHHCHNDPVKLKEALLVDDRKISTTIETTNCLSSAYRQLQDINTDNKITI